MYRSLLNSTWIPATRFVVTTLWVVPQSVLIPPKMTKHRSLRTKSPHANITRKDLPIVVTMVTTVVITKVVKNGGAMTHAGETSQKCTVKMAQKCAHTKTIPRWLCATTTTLHADTGLIPKANIINKKNATEPGLDHIFHKVTYLLVITKYRTQMPLMQRKSAIETMTGLMMDMIRQIRWQVFPSMESLQQPTSLLELGGLWSWLGSVYKYLKLATLLNSSTRLPYGHSWALSRETLQYLHTTTSELKSLSLHSDLSNLSSQEFGLFGQDYAWCTKLTYTLP